MDKDQPDGEEYQERLRKKRAGQNGQLSIWLFLREIQDIQGRTG